LADERRAARIAVLVGGGRVEVEVAGGLLRRGSGQLKVGLLVLGLAREQRCNAPTRKDRVTQLDLLDDNRAHVVLELHAPGLGVGGAGESAMQVLELARCDR